MSDAAGAGPPHGRETDSGLPLRPVYRPADAPGGDYAERLGDPGTYPFTRGRRPAGADGGWIQRELSGEGDPGRSNDQFRYLIAHGATGLDVIGDTPTMAWMDADHPVAAPAVGTQGVSLCCLQDWLDLYKGLPLDRLSLSHSVPAAFAVAGLYLTARRRGVDPVLLRGSVVQAPFYCEDCGYATHMPFELRVRLAVDSIERLRALRRGRDAGLVATALRAVCGAAEDRAAHLMPPLIAATKAGATIGEMAGALRAGYRQPLDPFGMVPLPW